MKTNETDREREDVSPGRCVPGDVPGPMHYRERIQGAEIAILGPTLGGGIVICLPNQAPMFIDVQVVDGDITVGPGGVSMGFCAGTTTEGDRTMAQQMHIVISAIHLSDSNLL